jgi:hypothetical protein
MKKIFLPLVLACSWFIQTANAQNYTQGDISLNFQAVATHDTNNCQTTGQLFYMITIQNSFLGDSVKVKDMFGGTLIYEAGNSNGDNPWNVMAPNYMAFGFLPDYQLTGGFASFFGPDTKVISGPDTIYNINNFYGAPVTDACSYGNVTGKIYADYNNDCVFNGSDVPLMSIPASASVTLNSPSMSSTSSVAYSNTLGDYDMVVQQSWMTGYNVSIPSQYQFIFPPSVCSPVSYSFNSLPQTSVDFSLQCSSNLDVRCAILANGVVRPLMPFTLSPYVNNTGCDAASGVLKLVLDANVVYDAGLSSNPATTISGDTLMWNYTDLSNLSNGSYWNSFFAGVYLTPVSGVNIGDTLCFDLITDIPVGDVDAANNTATLCLPVVNSYDPNLKEVRPAGVGIEGFIPTTTTELTYTIHFQNTGNAVAYNVSIIDTLDSHVQAGSLEILGATHLMVPYWTASNVVQFNFNYILLPDSTTNEPLSHGAVSFKVKLNTSLPIGTEIENTAHIIFDSNPAIVTNTTLNTIATPDGINDFGIYKGSVSVFPNPFSAQTTFVIQPVKPSASYSIEITDVLGKTVKSITGLREAPFTLNRTSLESGIYFYKIVESGTIIGIGKIVAE